MGNNKNKFIVLGRKELGDIEGHCISRLCIDIIQDVANGKIKLQNLGCKVILLSSFMGSSCNMFHSLHYMMFDMLVHPREFNTYSQW
jgi:hypothetical protein